MWYRSLRERTLRRGLNLRACSDGSLFVRPLPVLPPVATTSPTCRVSLPVGTGITGIMIMRYFL